MFWKNLTNNPKSRSTEMLVSAEGNTVDEEKKLKIARPSLTSKAHSFSTNGRRLSSFFGYGNSNNSVQTIGDISPTKMSDEDYRDHRDKFLLNRHGFEGVVFGVSLKSSLNVASTEIMIQNTSTKEKNNNESINGFGRIPIVVAKTGSYLKKNALDTSGIFRITGNNKRVKQLQYIFSIEETNYGMKFIDWDSYSVHDFTALLRRFLNNLKEPLIPLENYNDFRKPLQSRPRILKHLTKEIIQHPNSITDNKLNIESPKTNDNNNNNENNTNNNNTNDNNNDNNKNNNNTDELSSINNSNNLLVDNSKEKKDKLKREQKHNKKKLAKDIRDAIKEYQNLFLALNSDSKHLTLYLLDMLSLFDRNSEKNLMTAQNLSAIFQPSILSHPEHDMDPKQYELSRLIVEFLIEYSYKLVPFMLQTISNTNTENISTKNLSKQAKLIESNLNMNSTDLSTEQPKDINNQNINDDNKQNPKLSVIVTDENETSTVIENLATNSDSSSKSTSPTTFDSGIPKNIQRLSPTKEIRASSPLSSSFKASDEISTNLPPKMGPIMNKSLDSTLEVEKRNRPHSRSIGSTSIPQDMIPSQSANKRKSRFFSWIQKSSLLSDSGEYSVTEEEEEEEDFGDTSFEDASSSILSTSLPSPTDKSFLSRKKKSRGTTSNTTEFQLRPKSMFVTNKSSDEVSRPSQAIPMSNRSISYSGVNEEQCSSPTLVASINQDSKQSSFNSDSHQISGSTTNDDHNGIKVEKTESVLINDAEKDTKTKSNEVLTNKNHINDIKKDFSPNREPRSTKRQSWFMRLRSPSKSATRS